MAFTSPNMSLRIWNLLSDPYNHSELATNFAGLDAHDHSSGKGLPIGTAGLAAGAVTTPQIAANAVTTSKIAAGAVTDSQIAAGTITSDKLANSLAQSASINEAGQVAKGATSISATETLTNTAYGLMPTPDRVTGVVLPTNGLLVVWYQATWQESVNGASSAAIFLGSTQLSVADYASSPPLANPQAAVTGSTSFAQDNVLTSFTGGLVCASKNTGGGGYVGDTAAGQIVGVAEHSGVGSCTLSYSVGLAPVTVSGGGFLGGPCYIFAAAGTYTVSVQFKASSGSVTARNRQLWVSALSFA